MRTGERLVEAAAALLDAGGDSAVTLRAVAHAVGVSHNAPYKHFGDRTDLLAAVATRDFEALQAVFEQIRRTRRKPRSKLQAALASFISYGRTKPARYRLLFSDPEIARRGGDLERCALAAFASFAAIVGEFQAACTGLTAPSVDLAGLIYASAHGLIDLEASGRMREQNGLRDADRGVDLLLTLLSSAPMPESSASVVRSGPPRAPTRAPSDRQPSGTPPRSAPRA